MVAGMATKIHLVPLAEMTPGMAGAIRNQVIDAVVAQASRELSLPPDKLVVRDVLPKTDLGMYEVLTTALATDDWIYVQTTLTANVFTNMTANPATMGDQRFVAIYGVRDKRPAGESSSGAGTAGVAEDLMNINSVALVKIIVGGSDKVIWDIGCTAAYYQNPVALSPTAVIIPQNAAYAIQYKFTYILTQIVSHLQLIGVVVEPRGKVLSP